MSTVVAYAVGVLVLVGGLALSIALHEVGHLVPAKRFGVKVTQYMVGFGPTVFSRRRGETEYGVKAVPLGGYIRMIGMYAPERAAAEVPAGSGGRGRRARRSSRFSHLADEARAAAAVEIGEGEDPRTFYRLPVAKRLVVMLGGPSVNFVLAVVFLGLMLVGTGVQAPQAGAEVASVSRCVVPAGQADDQRGCTAADPPTPAAAAGIRPGDRVVSVAGERITDTARIGALVRPRVGQAVPILVERDGQRLDLTVTPVLNAVAALDADGNARTDASGAVQTVQAGFLGITSTAPVALERQPVSAVAPFVGDATLRTAGIVLTLPQRMVDIAQAAFGPGERDPNGPIGVVGVGRLSGEVATSDLFTSTAERVSVMLGILGSVNLALCVFNLIPLLPLDGGHVAGALWEGARRAIAKRRGRPDPGPFDLARLLPVTYAVVALFLGMSVLLLYADIVKPVTLG